MVVFVVLVVMALLAAGVMVLTGFRTVPTGHVGVVYNRFGRLSPEDRFPVRIHDGPGPQATTLRADRRYLRPSLLYRVDFVPRTHVPAGTIGLVMAKAGEVPPVDRGLCRQVDCDYFQDGRAFLAGGGQMGKQPMVLPGGAYYDINPELFEVVTTDTLGDNEKYGLTPSDLMEISIPEGATGVVIAREGAPPDDDIMDAVGPAVPGHRSFQLPWVFLDNGGRRGAQAETLTHGGVYRVNPWFARVVIIPTRELTLEWEGKDGGLADRYDAGLGQIVVNVEGHRLRFTMTQIIRIPPKVAPHLVCRFGEHDDMTGLGDVQSPTPVQRFVARVLGRTVESYFQSCAAEYEVLNFIDGHNEVRMELESRVKEALDEWGVEAGRTTLSDFHTEDPDLDLRRRTKARERDKKQVLEYCRDNAEIEEEIKRLKIETAKEQATVPVAETAARVHVLGKQPVVLKEALVEMAQMQSPQFIGDANLANGALPLVAAQQMVNQTLNNLQKDDPSPQKLDHAAGEPDDETDDGEAHTR